MRNTFAETFYQAALEDDRLSIVVADISPAGSMDKFRARFPERFINVGVSEQIMIGLTAGMALRGLRPFAYTIATFSLYRPFEFIRDDLCYQNLPVTVVGIGGGVTYSTLGGTHYAQEDVVVAQAVPNLTVIAPCDPEETRAATRWCATESQGPVYLRLAKAGEPVLTRDAEPWRFGKSRVVRRGSVPNDVCVLGYGPILATALKLADTLEAAGRGVTVMSVHTLKPLDQEGLAHALANHRLVVVLEECAPGGLSSRVKEIAWDTRASCRLECFTLKDEFVHCYGSHQELLAAHGLGLPEITARLGLG